MPVPRNTLTRSPVVSGRKAKMRGESRTAYVMLAPAIAILAAMVALPLLWNVLISVQSLRLVDLRNIGLLSIGTDGASLDNFRAVLGRPDFWAIVARTVLYAFLGTAGSIALGLWAALAMNKPFPGRGVVRALLLLPYVVPVIAATFVWRAMLSPQYGFVNAWLERVFGAAPIDFVGQRAADVDLLGVTVSVPVSFTVVVLFESWRYFPFAYIFIQARLQAVPRTLYEAATVDGTSIMQRFRHVTLPSLSGVIALLFLLRFIWNFNDFTNIYLLTGGGAGTRVIAVEIYEWLIGRSNPGAAAALSLVLAAVLTVALLIYFRSFGRREAQQ